MKNVMYLYSYIGHTKNYLNTSDFRQTQIQLITTTTTLKAIFMNRISPKKIIQMIVSPKNQ